MTVWLNDWLTDSLLLVSLLSKSTCKADWKRQTAQNACSSAENEINYECSEELDSVKVEVLD
jgi:hypothetical protein